MLACGASHAIMRTDLFARRPLLWLELASRRRATLLSSPNFGYQHYLRQYALRPPAAARPVERCGCIYDGAEPISADLCRRFVQTLAPHGLTPQSLFTVYGLAEATLAVSFPKPGSRAGDDPCRSGRARRRRARASRGGAADARPSSSSVGSRGAGHRAAHHRRRRQPGRRARGRPRRDPRRERHRAATSATRPRPPRGARADGWLDTGDLGPRRRWRARDHRARQGPGHRQRPEPLSARPRAHRRAACPASRPTASPRPACAAPKPRPRSSRCSCCTAATLEELRADGARAATRRSPGRPASRSRTSSRSRASRRRAAASCSATRSPRRSKPASSTRRAPSWRACCQPARCRAELAGAASTLARLQAICRRTLPERSIGPDTNLLEIDLSSLALARLHEAIDREFPGRLEVTDLLDHPTLRELWRPALDEGAA